MTMPFLILPLLLLLLLLLLLFLVFTLLHFLSPHSFFSSSPPPWNRALACAECEIAAPALLKEALRVPGGNQGNSSTEGALWRDVPPLTA
eukprot:8424351-Pyramimonas_sp.AAC.1